MISVTRERASACQVCAVRGTSPVTPHTYFVTHQDEEIETILLRMCHDHYVELIEAQQRLRQTLIDRCPGNP